MKISNRDIFTVLCVAVLVCTMSCATSGKSGLKTGEEDQTKTIQKVIGAPKERTKAIEQNKVTLEPQKKIRIWTTEPEQ